MRPGEAKVAQVSWHPPQAGRFEFLLEADAEDLVDEGFFRPADLDHLRARRGVPVVEGGAIQLLFRIMRHRRFASLPV